MHPDLIFDFGMHDGADTDFYLRKGFRVVALEADPELAAAGEVRFAKAIAAGRLIIVNKAVAAQPGAVILHRSQNTLWSTLNLERADYFATRRNITRQAVEVEAVTTAWLMQTYGVPYYLKIDIEGMDAIAAAGLRDIVERPRYVSIEAERRDLQTCRAELALLASLGYDEFNVVAQHRVRFQREPVPPREGQAAGNPIHESSGLFGADLPGPWLNQDQALDVFRRPLLNHYLTGSDALIKNRWLRAGLKRLGFRDGWFDIHARQSDRAKSGGR